MDQQHTDYQSDEFNDIVHDKSGFRSEFGIEMNSQVRSLQKQQN